jgi:hypothetical protein
MNVAEGPSPFPSPHWGEGKGEGVIWTLDLVIWDL